MKNWKIIFTILILLCLGFSTAVILNSRNSHIEKQTLALMDTFITVSAVGPKEISVPAVKAVFDRLQEINIKFNSLNPKSPIYAFNHQGSAITDPEILGLIRMALKISQESGGAFDITVSPLLELWGFYRKTNRVPAENEIQEVMKSVGFKHLLLSENKLEKDKPGVMIDLGGIAKGYALSEAKKVLKAKGVTSALIDLGGDVYALGKKEKALWKIGIKDPQKEGILGYVEVSDLAVISSGDYERFFIQDKKRYHHIFDPKTGYPAEKDVSAVTIIYNDPIAAQAWAKVPFILGAKKGLELLENIAEMEAIIVTASEEIIYSKGFKHNLKQI